MKLTELNHDNLLALENVLKEKEANWQTDLFWTAKFQDNKKILWITLSA